MSPFETVTQLYLDKPQEALFETYLVWHARHGFVYSTPDYFIMGRPVPRNYIEKLGVPLATWNKEDCDCWYIHAMAGNMAKAWDILPWPLPYLAWERMLNGRRELRVYPIDTVRRLTNPVVKPTPHEMAQTA